MGGADRDGRRLAAARAGIPAVVTAVITTATTTIGNGPRHIGAGLPPVRLTRQEGLDIVEPHRRLQLALPGEVQIADVEIVARRILGLRVGAVRAAFRDRVAGGPLARCTIRSAKNATPNMIRSGARCHRRIRSRIPDEVPNDD
jgi:hypothetical protein